MAAGAASGVAACRITAEVIDEIGDAFEEEEEFAVEAEGEEE